MSDIDQYMGRKPQMLAIVQELQQEPKKAITKAERLFHEINLLHLEGHYFTFDPKATRAIRDPLKEIDGRWRNPERNTVEPVSITPNLAYGTPSVFAYKVFQAIIKKLSDYGYPAPEKVSFGHREIMRLIGRDAYGGKDSKELVKVLHQFRHTGIDCWLYNKSTEEAASLSFSLATTFLYTYKKRGQISLFTIYLHPFIIKSINDQYTFCLNFGRMEKLEAISMALYKRLYFHFSNIYSQKKSKDFVFRKDYEEICRAWLGGLKVLQFKAKILNEQLGRHCEALKKTGLIKSYSVEKNAAKDGFNLVFHPGATFFEDYERFYSRRFQPELPFTLAYDENTIQKPQETVRYFYQKLYGADAIDGIALSEKETSFAASLLEKHSVAEMRGFVDYGLMEAAKTKFDIKTFGGLKKYYLPYTKHLAGQARVITREVEEEEKRTQERKLAAYDSYRQREVAKIRSSLSLAEIDAIENGIREELEAQHGAKIFSGWIRQRADRLLAEKHNLLSFTEWQERSG
jgi:hypothetical protein